MLCDSDRLALQDVIAELEADLVRCSWGRIALTCDREMTLAALDALTAAHRACNTLFKREVSDATTP